MFPRPGIPRRSAVFDGLSEPLRPGSSDCRPRNSKRWSPIRERTGRPSRAPLRARRPGPTGEREPPMSRSGPRRRDASGYGVVPGFRGLEGGRDRGDEVAEITAANHPGPPRPPARRREPVPVNRHPNFAGRPIAEVVGGLDGRQGGYAVGGYRSAAGSTRRSLSRSNVAVIAAPCFVYRVFRHHADAARPVGVKLEFPRNRSGRHDLKLLATACGAEKNRHRGASWGGTAAPAAS
jgi:hypothetical protein